VALRGFAALDEQSQVKRAFGCDLSTTTKKPLWPQWWQKRFYPTNRSSVHTKSLRCSGVNLHLQDSESFANCSTLYISLIFNAAEYFLYVILSFSWRCEMVG